MDQRVTIISLGVDDLAVSTDAFVNKFGWKKSTMSNDDIVDGLVQKGITLVKPPAKVFIGGVSSYVADFDENL
jgi:hypothetical protein